MIFSTKLLIGAGLYWKVRRFYGKMNNMLCCIFSPNRFAVVCRSVFAPLGQQLGRATGQSQLPLGDQTRSRWSLISLIKNYEQKML